MTLSGEFDQFWQCPRCGAQLASAMPAKLSPPLCHFGHPSCEMEQIFPEAFKPVPR